jgi:hypothetical protein
MRTRVHEGAWIAATIVAFSVGCKGGNPIHRMVKVTQEPSTNDPEFPSPQTRLASASVSRDTASSQLGTASRTESDESPHDPVAARSTPNRTTMARKTPASSPNQRPASETVVQDLAMKSEATSEADDLANLPADYAELLDAFRDSPPEVQQQALRQLIAVSSRGAKRTSSPDGIASALRSSVNELPSLPDEFPESEKSPVRLGVPQEKMSRKVDASTEVTNAAAQLAAEDEASGISLAGGSDGKDLEKSWAVKPASATTERSPQPLVMPGDAKAIESAASNASMTASLETASTDELYAELLERMAKATAGESDADRYRRQIIGRHLMLFSGNPDGAVDAIDGMSPKEQEFLRHHLLGTWSMVDTAGHPVATRRWSTALPELRLATQHLSLIAESLEVRSLAFCREIQSYGQTTPFESNRFEPGQKVILYCEIDNFTALSTQDGFETHLQGSYEVFDSKGQKVAGQVLPADKQVCANHLRDYFIAYQMGLPNGLEPGSYRLELTMECLQGQKYGQASIPFEITRPSTR